jgi:hypothetical protein
MHEMFEERGWLDGDALNDFGPRPERRFAETMRRLDRNGNGIIDPEEATEMREEDARNIKDFGIEVAFEGCGDALDYDAC